MFGGFSLAVAIDWSLTMFLKVVVPFFSVCLALSTAGLVGAPMDADMNEQGAQNALRFAVAQLNRASNDMYVSDVSRVISVKKQVGAGDRDDVLFFFNVSDSDNK